MSLRFRQIFLHIETAEAVCGASIVLPDGLVVLRAANSSGKSTVIQSAIYALGLEGMLSASHDVPLPHVMTDNVVVNNKTLKVLASDVTVEIENGKGERVTVSRQVKGGRDRNLISVVFGPALSNPNKSFQRLDYFVREPGAVMREAGFHHWLVRFLEWEIPTVTKFDGTECPLYMECMFPLMIIEQKRAWAGIQARMPVHYRIRDVGKRAIEFLLKLDVYDTAAKRLRLKEEADIVSKEWRSLYAQADGLIRPANGVVKNLPQEPQKSWPPPLAVQPLVSRGGKWASLREAETFERGALADLEQRKIPLVAQVSAEVTDALRVAETELAETDFAAAELFAEIQVDRSQFDGLERRIEALDEDVRRSKDVRKLRQMGSTGGMELATDICPTCHQHIDDSLLPVEARQQPMSIDDNIAYLASQLETFRAVQASSASALTGKDRRLAGLRVFTDQIRARIRSLKETLVSEGKEPSVAAIEERLRLRQSIKQLAEIRDTVEELLERFKGLAERWNLLQQELERLPRGDLSARDDAKLKTLERLVIEQCKLYGVTSLPPDSLRISRDNYKPIHDGFELEFDLSASDMIRVIWAYLHGLLELSREVDTNHLGLLVLDEPRQQETARVSMKNLLAQASLAIKHGQQVIIATSEEESNIRPMLRDVPHTLINFNGSIIRPLSGTRI